MNSPMTPAQMMMVNQQQRAAVLANAIEMKQTVFSKSIDPSAENVVNIAPRNVGLIKGFIISITGTIKNTSADTGSTRTQFGSANLLRQIKFSDLNNNERVSVPGWHLATLNSARQGWAYGGVYANDLAMGYGDNWNVNAGASALAFGEESEVRHIYYLPLAYSGDDLRGAIYAAVVSATMNLQLTINDTPLGTDKVSAIYNGGAGGWKAGTKVDVEVTQVYLDQLPVINGGPVLPIMDLNNIYELKQTTLTGVTANQDFAVPYSNFRDFLSTTVIYNNGNELNSGSDVNYWALTSANFTNIFKLKPEIVALEARQIFMADPPKGVYYFNHRSRPISTISFGNMELNLNAGTVNANAALLVGFEAFAQTNQLVSNAASSLPTG